MIINPFRLLPRWLVAFVIGFPLSGISHSADPSDREGRRVDVISPETAAAATALANPTFSQRQRAMRELWRSRERSQEIVQRAARDPNPEIAARAERILELWRRGVLPETPPHVARRVQSGDLANAVEQLLEAGQFSAAAVAVDESLGTIDRETVQKRVSRRLTDRFPFYARTAFERDAVEELLQLVDIAADSKELAACRLHLMRWLGQEIAPDDLLPQAAETWSRSERAEATALLLVLRDRHGEAVDFVERTEPQDDELQRAVKTLAGRWDELAGESRARAEAAPAGSAEQTRYWSHALIAAARGGVDAIRTAAIDALSHQEAADDNASIALRWQTLAVHGEVDAACGVLGGPQPEAAAEVALAAVQKSRAFGLLGWPLERVEPNLDRWLAEGVTAQKSSEGERPVAEVRRLLALMKCLISIGRHDLAWRIAEGLSRGNVAVGRVELRAYVISSLPAPVRRDWVRRLAVFPGEATLSTAAESMLVRVFPDTDSATLELLMESFEKRMPHASLRERLDVVTALLDGKLPHGFDPKTGFRFIYQQLPDKRQRQVERVGGRVVFQSQSQPTIGLVHFFRQHGQAEYARRCLRQMHASGNLKATFELAERALESGRSGEARELLEQIWTSVSEQGIRDGGRSGTTLAAKSLVGLWIAARRGGDPREAERWERLLRLVLASPSTETSLELLRYLVDREERELADHGFRGLLPMTAMGSPEGAAFYTAAYAFALFAAEEQPEEAARWFDMAFSGTLESTQFVPAAYVSLPLVTHRWSLQAAVQRRDEAGVREAFERILALDPIDIRFAEELLPSVREAGMEDLARQTLDRIIDAGLRYSRDYPFDATTANNLAWVAAVNGQRLQDALQLSERAVRMHPESAIYRDTLAEILFRLGRHEEAVQIERACLLDDPGQWHLHEQLKRFQHAYEAELAPPSRSR